MKNNNLSKNSGLFALALAVLVASIMIVGCGSNSDVQPSGKDNTTQPMNAKKTPKGGIGGTQE